MFLITSNLHAVKIISMNCARAIYRYNIYAGALTKSTHSQIPTRYVVGEVLTNIMALCAISTTPLVPTYIKSLTMVR